MKPDHFCVNHPTFEAISFCHHCKDWLCTDCAIEGPTYYFCHKPDCLQALKTENALMEGNCPGCGEKFIPNAIHCGSCGKKLRDPTKKEKSEDLVTIFRFNSPIEAHLAQTKLESEEIESYIADEHMVSINPGYDIAFGGVRLQVKKSDVHQAVQILKGNQEDPI
jgi:hypothetical protein